MANIQVRKDNDQPKPAPVVPAWEASRWEPFRMLRELASWDPFREMQVSTPQMPPAFMPSFEVKETKEGYSFKADLPGVKESDIEVTMTGNRLNVTGKRDAEREEKTDKYYCYERSYGDFTRSFTLPEGADAKSVLADLKDGVLTISLRKMPEAQPKKIAIETAKKP